jgi:aliphatic sulfonates family ABC transporter substrate-binding protein
MITRRTLLHAIPAVASVAIARAEPSRRFRIGYQKNGILVVAKQQQAIENRLRSHGVSVDWTEFSYGPPLLEALRLGSVDFGTVGDTPPIFAQAAHADLLYVAVMPAGSSSAAILLPPGSTLHTLADLKGRRVAFARGSAAHNLIVAALEKAGLSLADIRPIPLAPADAAAAFTRGSVDAWAVWDPYYAIAEVQQGVRVLATSRDIAPQNAFCLSSRDYVQANAAVIEAVIDELAKVAAWSNAHRPQVAQLLADGTGVPLDAMQRTVARSAYAIGPVTDPVVAQQQLVADRFYRLGLIPARIAIADVTWRPST